MPLSFRTLSTMSLSTLVGVAILGSRLIQNNRLVAEPFQPIKEAEVSIGCRGSRLPDAVAEARRKLLAYLADRKDRYTAAGPMRVMGYNSPFVPRANNFFEVQIPIKAVRSDGSKAGKGPGKK